MGLLKDILAIDLVNPINQIFINYEVTDFIFYTKNSDTKIFIKPKGSANLNFNSFKTQINNKVGDSGKKSSFVLKDLDNVMNSISTKIIKFKVLVSMVSKALGKENITGYGRVEYIPEMNIINVLTKDFLLLESIYNGQLAIKLKEPFIKVCKSAYLQVRFRFYWSMSDKYISLCKTGKGESVSYSHSNSSIYEYRRLRYLTSFYPIAVNFTESKSVLSIKNSKGVSLFNYLADNFKSMVKLNTTNISGRRIDNRDYEGEPGFILFTTKAEIAKYLGIKTDFMSFSVLQKIFISKVFEGFFSSSEDMCVTDLGKKVNSNSADMNLLIRAERVKERYPSEFYKVITQEYVKEYIRFLSGDNLDQEIFGGTVVLCKLSPSVENNSEYYLNKFKNILS